MNSWVGAPNDIRSGDDAIKALQQKNDSEFWNAHSGVSKVSLARWREAQQFEAAGWLDHWSYAASDRNEEHQAGFHNYTSLPMRLGDVCEIGCGPFTQLATILQLNHVAESVTLADPLLDRYKQMQNCPYAKGDYYGYKPRLINQMGELLAFSREFDTAICINVLEHVMNAEIVLDRLFESLRIGGYVVFGERWNDGYDPKANFDVGHPIILRKVIIDEFKSLFDPVFENGIYFIGRKYEAGTN